MGSQEITPLKVIILRPERLSERLEQWHPTCLSYIAERNNAFVRYTCV
jgi:hypothetical protein